MPRPIKITLACALGLLLACAAVEIDASFTKEGNAIDLVRDPDLRLVRRPNTSGWSWMRGANAWKEVRINEHSMRDDSIPGERDPSEVRVLCIGDSFTFGDGVDQDEPWPRRMQLALGPPGSSGVRVMNGGANGWFTGVQRLFVEKKFDALDPDVVVLGWNWNDLGPASASGEFSDVDQILGDGCWLCDLGLSWDGLRSTHTFRYVLQRKHGARRTPSKERLAESFQSYARTMRRIAIEPEIQAEKLRKERFGDGEVSHRFWRETDTTAFVTTRAEINALAQFLRDRDRALFVALLPEPTWPGPGPYPPTARMTSLLDQIDVPWIDVQPAFLHEPGAGTGRRGDLWLEYDPVHPNVEGQRVIAETVLEGLRAHDLLRARGN